MQASGQNHESAKTALILICLLSFAIKLACFLYFPRIIHPDEIFQNLEPANYLVHGTAVIQWEYIIGLRSWLMPIMLAGPMEVGSWLSADPIMALLPVYGFMLLTSLIPVVCGYLWGRNLANRQTGLLIAFCAAFASDLVLMAPHTFTEVLAGHLLVAGPYLAYPGRIETRTSRLIAAGIVFAIVLTLRVHLAPAVGVAYLYSCRLDFRRWLIMGAAAFLTLCLSMGLLDWLSWGTPFRTVWVNITVNLVANVSASFGTTSALEFVGYVLFLWHIPGIIFLAFLILGVRKFPFLSIIALLIILPHLLIAHKEWRFIFPALPLLAIIAGFGVAQVAKQLLTAFPDKRWAPTATYVGLGCIWLVMSAAMLSSPLMSKKMLHNEGRKVLAFRHLTAVKSVCGVGTYENYRTYTPGHAYLPNSAKLFRTSRASFPNELRAFNVVLAPIDQSPPSPLYRKIACFDDRGRVKQSVPGAVCLWKRLGGCNAKGVPQPTHWPDYFLDKEGRPDPAKIDPFRPPHSWFHSPF